MSASNFVPNNQHRNLRACMVCSVVQTHARFMTAGCPNCEPFLELAGSADAIAECTSQVFDGLITVAETKKSWVARWQRLEGYAPGVYAVKVEGTLPEEVIIAVENAGIKYVPRDGSANDETN
ncbi:putative transcriptional elongation protein Spt4 [Cenococcum geophilum]